MVVGAHSKAPLSASYSEGSGLEHTGWHVGVLAKVGNEGLWVLEAGGEL